jgi:hypothetical protein
VYSSTEASSTTYWKASACINRRFFVDIKASLSCLFHTEIEDVIEFARAAADDRGPTQCELVGCRFRITAHAPQVFPFV